MTTKVRIYPGVCQFVADVTVEKKASQEFEISITSECPNLGPFKEAIKKIKISDAINRPKSNLILQKSAESLPHSDCSIAMGIIKACMVEIRFAIKRDVKVEFITEDKQANENE